MDKYDKAVQRPIAAFHIAKDIRDSFPNDWDMELSVREKIDLIIEKFLAEDVRWSDEDKRVIALRALDMLSKISRPS